MTREHARPSRRRRGAIYIIVMAAALVVAVLGLTALTRVRIQRRHFDDLADLRRARQHARSAIEIGLLRIENDANWRTTYSNGTWEQGVAIGSGTYTLEGIDPIDGNLSDADDDPLELTGTGMSGTAVQKLRLRLEAKTQPVGSLSACVHTGVRVQVSEDKTLRVTGAPASTNGSLQGEDGTVLGDAEGDSWDGELNVTGTLTTGVPAKSMPNSGMFDLYKNLATALTFAGNLDKDVLTPGLNTYNGGLNTNGVYYIDTGGQDITIKATRIHGTLVVRTGSSKKVIVDDAVFIHNYRADYPALIVDGRLLLKYKSDSYGLIESAWTTNFNPAGAPYQGSTDSNQDDTYPNELQGLVHAKYAIDMEQTARVRGAVIGEADVKVQGTNEIIYDSQLWANPPEGFRTTEMQILTGSWRRVVN